ncbi:ATP-binding protein [Nonomuraea sp. NPDC049695]|uniref:ATP-binding protein n=1 Tax=Nonomuraea sp. NPDC049695 TaxID=3154734 RepID=UPI003448A0BB
MSTFEMKLVSAMRFPGCPQIIRDVRIYAAHWLVMALPEVADDENLLDNLRLLVTELAANAIKHTMSGRWRHGSFQVRLWLGAGRIRIEVVDQGWWSGPRLRNDSDEVGGRGLQILAAVATKWGVSRRWFGRTVWFELLTQVPIAESAASPGAPARIGNATPARSRARHELRRPLLRSLGEAFRGRAV